MSDPAGEILTLAGLAAVIGYSGPSAARRFALRAEDYGCRLQLSGPAPDGHGWVRFDASLVPLARELVPFIQPRASRPGPCPAPRHDGQTAYGLGCRCPEAREVWRVCQKRRREGRNVMRKVPSGPAVRMLTDLRGRGWSVPEIADAAGVSTVVLYGLLNRPKPTSTWLVQQAVHRAHAALPGWAAGNGTVAAEGTARRIGALEWMGWPLTELARRTGYSVRCLSNVVTGQRTVKACIAAAVRACYDELSMTFGPSQMTRTLARRDGKLGPLAWDDDTIDDPDIVGYRASRRDRRCGSLTRAERRNTVTELTGLGWPVNRIARELGVCDKTVLRDLGLAS